jgi:hypothetical protein
MDCAGSFEPEGAEDDGPMSERILMKFIVGQRVIKQGEDSRFEGEVDHITWGLQVALAPAVTAIASSNRLRSPTTETPMSLRSSIVSRGSRSASILLSRKATDHA